MKNNPRLFDTHCHLNFNAFKNDAQEIIKECLAQNLWMIIVGSQIDTSKRAVEYAQQYDQGVYATVGIHPVHLKETEIDEQESNTLLKFKTRAERFDKKLYEPLIIKNKTVAIGEIGLDYGYTQTDSEKKLQQNQMVEQIHFALDHNLPVILHCRSAYDDLVDILSSTEFKNKTVQGVAHFFSGTITHAKRLLDLGYYLSFSGPITFVRDRDDTIQYAPLDRILIETDAPYATPAPHRGKRNTPQYVEFVARRVAELKKLTFEDIAAITTQNAMNLFNIDII